MLFRANRNFAEFSDDWLVALIRGVDRDRAVAEHGFRARGGDGDVVARLAQRHIAVGVFLDIFVSLPARQRIFEMPHRAVDLDILDLKVGNRGLELGVPVHKALVLVDEALIVELDEHFGDGIDHLVARLAHARPW